MDYDKLLEEIKYYETLVFKQGSPKSSAMIGRIMSHVLDLRKQLFNLYEKDKSEKLKEIVIEDSIVYIKVLERLLKWNNLMNVNIINIKDGLFARILQKMFEEYERLKDIDDGRILEQCEKSQVNVKNWLLKSKFSEKKHRVMIINKNLKRMLPNKMEQVK